MEIIIGGVVLVGIIVFVLVSESLNRKKALTSEDYAKLKEIASELIPNAEEYTVVYAWWDKTDIKAGGSKIRATTYMSYYAVCFNKEDLVIIPLSITKGNIGYDEAFTIKKEDLNMVNGDPKGNWMTLIDKNDQEIVSVIAMEENLHGDTCHVNIIQTEQIALYRNFIENFMESVNTANGRTPSGKIGKN